MARHRPAPAPAGPAAASKSPIKIGFVTSLTGNASSTFSTSATGAKAYFDAVNKQGGYNGHPIDLVTEDDTSSTTGAASAIQLLVSQGVFAIISDSAYFFGGTKFPQQAGIPVIGSGFDGPEWGQQPNTNMFSFSGGVDPNHAEIAIRSRFRPAVQIRWGQERGCPGVWDLPVVHLVDQGFEDGATKTRLADGL